MYDSCLPRHSHTLPVYDEGDDVSSAGNLAIAQALAQPCSIDQASGVHRMLPHRTEVDCLEGS